MFESKLNKNWVIMLSQKADGKLMENTSYGRVLLFRSLVLKSGLASCKTVMVFKQYFE